MKKELFFKSGFKNVLILLFILLIFVFPQFYIWEHISDDSYISFRYAERLLNGQGLTFNDNERVEGFSNPLWLFLISTFSFIFNFDIAIVARILGLLSLFGVIFLSFLSARTLLGSHLGNRLFFFTSIILFFTPGFHVYSTSGLEVPFLALLLSNILYFSISEKKEHLYIASTIIGAVAITRPEGLLYGLIWLIVIHKFEPRKFSKILIRVLLVVAPFFIYTIFRVVYFERLLPNTAYAKPSGTYSYIHGFEESTIYLIVLSLPLIIILLSFNFSHAKTNKKLLYTVTGFLLSNLIFVFYAGGDWMLFGRFFLPVWPVLVLMFSYLILCTISRLTENKFSFNLLAIIILLSVIVTQSLLFKDSWLKYNSNNNYANLMKGKDQLSTGKWLDEHVASGATVATFRLGGISYGAPELTFYDTYGLTDKEITSFRQNVTGVYNINENPVIKRKPNILAILNQNGHRMITVENVSGLEDYLEEHYDFVKSIPQGTGINIEIWVDKKIKTKILKR